MSRVQFGRMSATLRLVTLEGLGNCSESDFDFLYVPCLMDEGYFVNLTDTLKKAAATKAFYSDDFSNGGHGGCVLELEPKDILEHMKVEPITVEEANTLLKFHLATPARECHWYRRFRSWLMGEDTDDD